MNTEEEAVAKAATKKVEAYFSLGIKIAALLFAAGQVYAKLSSLEVTVGNSSEHVTQLLIREEGLKNRIIALEREVFDRRQ